MPSPGCFPVFWFPRDFASPRRVACGDPAGAEKNLRPRVGGRRSLDNPSADHSLSARNVWPVGTRVRSSGLRFVLLGPAFPPRFLGTVARSGPFVLAYSGGTAAAFHRLPIPGSIFSCPPHHTPVRRRVKDFFRRLPRLTCARQRLWITFWGEFLGVNFGDFGRFLGGHRPWRWRPGGFFTARVGGGRKTCCENATFCSFLQVFGRFLRLFAAISGFCYPCHVHTFMCITSRGRA